MEVYHCEKVSEEKGSGFGGELKESKRVFCFVFKREGVEGH